HSQQLAYHTAASIASELAWMTALRLSGQVVVPAVVAARDGTLVQTMVAPGLDQPRHAVMFTFLTGTEPDDSTLIAGFERLGEITARMHLHAQSWTLPEDFARHTWDQHAILGRNALWGRWEHGMGVDQEARRILDRLVAVLLRRTAALPRDR